MGDRELNAGPETRMLQFHIKTSPVSMTHATKLVIQHEYQIHAERDIIHKILNVT